MHKRPQACLKTVAVIVVLRLAGDSDLRLRDSIKLATGQRHTLRRISEPMGLLTQATGKCPRCRTEELRNRNIKGAAKAANTPPIRSGRPGPADLGKFCPVDPDADGSRAPQNLFNTSTSQHSLFRRPSASTNVITTVPSLVITNVVPKILCWDHQGFKRFRSFQCEKTEFWRPSQCIVI